jgi:hypothetical protein
MANLLTLSRLLLLIGVVVIACQPTSAFQFISVPLMILVFVTDGLDDAMYEPCRDRIKRHQAEGDRLCCSPERRTRHGISSDCLSSYSDLRTRAGHEVAPDNRSL